MPIPFFLYLAKNKNIIYKPLKNNTMATYSQASFGARLSRAKQLYLYIHSFEDYSPDVPELTPPNFLLLIESMDTTQQKYTQTHHLFAESAKERANIFTKNDDSINKKATLIKAYVKAKFKNYSQQFKDVEKLVNKIRGEKPLKTSEDSDVQTISRTEKSYGSQLQNFTDLVTLAIQFGTEYAPANQNIKMTALQDTLRTATTLNNETTRKFAEFKPKIAQRQDGFVQLSETANRIKEIVKSQYGITSDQYKLIKGLNFSI